MAILPKKYESVDVYTRTMERINLLYDRYDDVTVSFSGGKDSTVAFQLAYEVARSRGRLPLKTYFFDEECIHEPTIDYVRRVGQMDGVDLLWLCLPVKHRNACSRRSPWWYCWDPDQKEKWVRDLPPEGLLEYKGFEKGMTMPEFAPLVYDHSHGLMACIRGLRAEESINRYRAVARREKDNWIGEPNGNYVPVSPIYDWTDEDVWLAPQMFGWDYNRTYDLMSMAGISLHDQRVCPPFGEEPLRGLWQYQVCFPELWNKMCQRVPGAATAARYSQTELYGFGRLQPPPGITWQAWTYQLLELYSPSDRRKIAGNLQLILQRHQERAGGDSVPESKAHPVSGLSWAFLAMVVSRGDFKNRRNTSLSTKGDRQEYLDKVASGELKHSDERRGRKCRPMEGGTRYEG